MSSAGIGDVYAAMFRGSDGDHIASKRMGGSDQENGLSVAVGSDGAIFVAGSFQGFAEFGDKGLTSAGGTDGFVIALAPLQ